MMKKENLDLAEGKVLTQKDVETNGRKPYLTPKLRHYGTLTELVQANPNRAADGGTGDCVLS